MLGNFFSKYHAIWYQAKRGNKSNGKTKNLRAYLVHVSHEKLKFLIVSDWLKPDSSVGRARY